MDTNIFLWDVYGECEKYAFLQGHKNAVLEVCWNYDGTELVSVGADKMVCIWDAAVFLHFMSNFQFGTLKRKLKGHASFVNGCDASKQNDNLVISCSDDGTCKVTSSLFFHSLQLWDTRTHETVKTIAHPFQVTSCCFNEDTTQIITGGIDGIIRIYDMNTFTPSLKLPQLPEMITGLRLAPDGGYL